MRIVNLIVLVCFICISYCKPEMERDPLQFRGLLGFVFSKSNEKLYFSYPQSAFILTLGIPINAIVPTISGTMSSCTANPSLPIGLTIDPQTCAITGTPTQIQNASSYSITATNSTGFITTEISITIQEVAPSALNYPGSPFVLTQGITITNITPTYTGTISSCASTPPLPADLILSSSCAISGIPNTPQPSTPYTITASNPIGSTSTTISITINIPPPTALSYTGNPFVFTKNQSIPSASPMITGTVSSWSVNPALPLSLSLNPSTGELSGTPNVLVVNSIHTVTATNSSGSTSFDLNITINDSPPSSLVYAGTQPFVFTKGTSITPISPSITGTPVAISGTSDYTVTVTNSGGSISTTLTIIVTPSIPDPITVPSSLPYTSFSVTPVTGATGYTWTVPSYSTITSGQGTSSINVTHSGTCGSMGFVTVVANSPAGDSPPRKLHHILNQALQNASAEQGNLSYWSILAESGTGWAGGVVKGVGFAISYIFGIKAQEIDLVTAGYSTSFLDSIPTIFVGEKFGNPPSGWDGYGKSYIKVELRDAAHLTLQSWNIGTPGTGVSITNAGSAITIFKNQFTGYPSGVRYVYWEDGGWDNPRSWAGYYGPGLSQAYVVIGSCVEPY